MNPTEQETVRYERRDRLALIRLDRPDAANAIDPPTLQALGEFYHRADNDDAVVVVVLHAAGPDFSAGLDPVSFLPTLQARTYSPDGPGRINPFGTTTRLSKPLVAAVQGRVGAMAHELMLAADIRVAASDTSFSQGEMSRGTTPAEGGGLRMPLEVGWGNAMRWILTGEPWDAAEALARPGPGGRRAGAAVRQGRGARRDDRRAPAAGAARDAAGGPPGPGGPRAPGLRRTGARPLPVARHPGLRRTAGRAARGARPGVRGQVTAGRALSAGSRRRPSCGWPRPARPRWSPRSAGTTPPRS
ncbi:hypothetical protein C1I98_05165 [Spongiactinospora gelatinilytica]|uniref:Enoyl-CoA hydratase n=1 Tax=Spongiactinospora gelatinilytica TaxID=2666298 RepID=A0A2W2HVZ9_9ACTN|nr:hypothetical protein C1I98_05165 [Spongiactinospora gelatinilytica]